VKVHKEDRWDRCDTGGFVFLLLVLFVLFALTSCAPGHYRSRQFHDLGQPGSSLHTTNVYKR